MIFKLLPELLEQKERLEKEIANYDLKVMWSEILDKMSIPSNDIAYEDDEYYFRITIKNRWNLYSWLMPKGVYTIKCDENELIIDIDKKNKLTVNQVRKSD